MKKELDKELYPDYVYPEFTPEYVANEFLRWI